MSKENLYKYIILGLICFGAILRITAFLVNPVNNSYDDHLEVIKIYSDGYSRPAPFQCWECYQPPLYYYIGAIVFNFSESLGFRNLSCWKAVQLINPLLSICVLIIAYIIMRFSKLPQVSTIIILSFLVILPRDIFTSSMIGNDYLLVFFVILSFYLFLKTASELYEGRRVWNYLLALVSIAMLGSLTKQHGMLIHLFPFCICLLLLLRRHNEKWLSIPIILFGLLLSVSEELWKYKQTGVLLVSNQHYFDYAIGQFPGNLEEVEFFSFRITELYKEPFISERTSQSFFTELFARTFFDYEWRFLSPKIPLANTIGIIGYSLGLVWLFFFGLATISYFNRIGKFQMNMEVSRIIIKIAPLIMSLLFMLVPLIQTMRYPYFSSMKAMFMLSGIVLFLISMGSQITVGSFVQKIGIIIIALNIVYGILLILSIVYYMGISLNHLHGPLWLIPIS